MADCRRIPCGPKVAPNKGPRVVHGWISTGHDDVAGQNAIAVQDGVAEWHNITGRVGHGMAKQWKMT